MLPNNKIPCCYPRPYSRRPTRAAQLLALAADLDPDVAGCARADLFHEFDVEPVMRPDTRLGKDALFACLQ